VTLREHFPNLNWNAVHLDPLFLWGGSACASGHEALQERGFSVRQRLEQQLMALEEIDRRDIVIVTHDGFKFIFEEEKALLVPGSARAFL
jgi:hypothetical protein